MFVPDSSVAAIHALVVQEKVRLARTPIFGVRLPPAPKALVRMAVELGQLLVAAGTSLQKLEQHS